MIIPHSKRLEMKEKSENKNRPSFDVSANDTLLGLTCKELEKLKKRNKSLKKLLLHFPFYKVNYIKDAFSKEHKQTKNSENKQCAF